MGSATLETPEPSSHHARWSPQLPRGSCHGNGEWNGCPASSACPVVRGRCQGPGTGLMALVNISDDVVVYCVPTMCSGDRPQTQLSSAKEHPPLYPNCVGSLSCMDPQVSCYLGPAWPASVPCATDKSHLSRGSFQGGKVALLGYPGCGRMGRRKVAT